MRYLTLMFIFLPFLSMAQLDSKRDSILTLIHEEESDSVKAIHFLNLGDLYQYQEQDSAIHYYRTALDIAHEIANKEIEAKCYNYIGVIYYYQSDYDKTLKFFEKSLSLKKKIGNKGGIANSYNNIGLIARKNGDLAKALSNFKGAFTIRREMLTELPLKDSAERKESLKKIGHALMNMGNVHYQLGDYPKAIEKYKNSISYYDSIGSKPGIAGCYNNIGSIFEEQEDYQKARHYYLLATDVYEKNGSLKNLGTTYNNIGETYLKENKFGLARKYFDRSLHYREEVNDKHGISSVYSNQAEMYFRQGNYQASLNIINEALKLDNEIGDKQGICEDLNFLGKIYLEQGNPNESIEMASRSLRISNAMNTPLQTQQSHFILAQAYEKLGQYKLALKEYKSYKQIEDKMFNKEKHKQIEELEMKYRVAENQQELEKQDLQLQKQEAEIRQQRTQKYALIGGAALLFISSILIYISLVQKRGANKELTRQKKEIESKNEELKQQNEEIKSQRDELQRQRDIANKQRNEIAVKNDEITSSIQYAKSIQAAVLPEDYAISKILEDYFILFQPKDIVSGDFYFVNQKHNKAIFAAVDCTGHGVPGAFMSLLGMSLLNDIIDEMRDLDAGEILNILRTRMIQSLHQKNISDENRDGMDLALCVWDKNTSILEYAGAYNPLYLVRDKKLLEYKPTRMSISIRSKLDQSYHKNRIQLKKGDVFYIFSDGFADQINGRTNKKMTRQRFKDLLMEVHSYDVSQQKEELQKFFNEWKDGYEQVDDVLVMGVKA